MADALAGARKALGRGRPDEALVFLWNALEPARLAGDRRALATIAGLAQRIRAQGETVERREAERLLEAVAGAGEAQAEAVGTVTRGGDEAELTLGADWEPGGEDFAVGEEEAGEAEAARARGSRAGSLIFLLVFVAIVVINILRAIQGGD